MAITAKYVEIKLCNRNAHYKKFRSIKPLEKGPNKGKFAGWNDVKGGKRFSTCSECEKDRFYKSYRSNPIPQLIYNFKKRAKLAGVPFDLEPQDIKNKLNLANTMCPVLGVDRDMLKIISLL